MVKIKISVLVCIALAIAFIMLAPQLFDGYGVGILNQVAIYITLAISYNLINGVTGQFSLGPNDFITVGAYATALVLSSSEQKLDLSNLGGPNPTILALHISSFTLALLVTDFSACISSLILAFAVFRVRGDYLAITTLGFDIIIRELAINFPNWTNEPMGLNDIPLLSNLCWTDGMATISITLILNLVYSKFGRAMQAIRDDEDATGAMGVNTFWIKILAFGTSAFLEDVGGGSLVCLLASISPEQFGFEFTLMLLIITALDNLGSTTGIILGTILVISGREWLRFLDEMQTKIDFLGIDMGSIPGPRMVVFSLILILAMLLTRRGIFDNRELNSFFKRPSRKGLK